MRLAVSFVLLAALPAHGSFAANDPCKTLPLFDRYQRAGLLTVVGSDSVELHLRADRNDAGCGAPDCYGTELFVRIELDEKDAACRIRSVSVSRRPFSCPDTLEHRTGVDPSPVVFKPDDSEVDLGSRLLERLTIRSHELQEAIVLLPHNFFYFTEVEPGGALRESLDPLNGDSGCCWGAYSSTLGSFERQ